MNKYLLRQKVLLLLEKEKLLQSQVVTEGGILGEGLVGAQDIGFTCQTW